MERIGNHAEVLLGVVGVESLAGVEEAVLGQLPNPHRAIGHDQNILSGSPAMTTGVRPDLIAQGVNSAARHHVATTRDDQPASGGFAPLSEAKASGPINPVPAARLLPSGPPGRTFAPVVALPDVLCIQLDNQGKWCQ